MAVGKRSEACYGIGHLTDDALSFAYPVVPVKGESIVDRQVRIIVCVYLFGAKIVQIERNGKQKP